MKKRTYQITIGSNVADGYSRGRAELITDKEGDGFLWLGSDEKNCIGWIDNRQLDAISRQWLKVRSKRSVAKRTKRTGK